MHAPLEGDTENMGRPTKRTARNAERICEMLSQGNSRKTAYVGAGISESTFLDWVREDAGFRARVETAEEAAIANLLEEVRAASRDREGKRGDWKAAAWILERRRPADFGRRQRIDITAAAADEIAGALGAMVDSGRMTREQAEGVIHEFEKRHAEDDPA